MTNMPPSDPEPDATQLHSAPIDAAPPPPPPPDSMVPLPVMPPPQPARQPGKLRTYISVGVLVLILGGILYAIRNNADAGSLAVGTCFDRPSTSQDFSTVEKHECTEPHDAEVVLVSEYDEGDTFPISLTMDRFIEDRCVPAALTYTGKPAEQLGDYQIGLFSPNRDAWDDGERTFTCYILRFDEGKMTQSVRGASAS